ncbi:ribonucleoside-diphosphate reductase subunit alpha [Clavibacter michiganensis]|uniref:Ribonucleoside-diphosphate reductase n=1 Tax=Clavibacter michiganensis subsp. insidiosus TaxID=33014 RepID=A0A0D5CK41_9MICO|nr:ribonucleoside-diphosphate reductase subunit alpha [Clavibacter michiganensis]AJW79637.1 ribonucleotide-diphosphate reductase subunit alpha [Clavibacter michiganensis subsp. insidiosus]AWF97583.1 ribonucleotide-diphosphate reductase subunit alpha [Clavibacter michiganensis subsp. insidiosus]AWG02340.1 ribonucleotide-diphosphate reductase subunit alpha [Clavibacter michiganensis subsp. insidiosus]OQJ59203.1 ribonucleoside-diphosphate reductase subunit alpha [Clavibacter michiganensis subsp. i
MSITVVKRDGSKEPYDANRINLAIEDATQGLDENIGWVTQIASELEITLFDGITTQQLDEAVIQVALQNVKDDPAFDTVAARLLLKTIYKRVLGDYSSPEELKRLHAEHFARNIQRGVDEMLLDSRLVQLFDLERLAQALEPSHDELLKYIGVVTLNNRYGIKGRNGDALEVPQYFWMRIAMGLTLNEQNPTETAIAFYEKMSKLEYLAAGSTLVNAGTIYPQLANCFVMEMQDDIEHIAKTTRDVMWLTKGTGGIGLSVSKLRAQGSPIRSNNTTSTGPIPFMHTIDSVLRAVSRGGKKFGALCFYMENWHLDFPEFLDLRQNSGDPYRRTRTANTAVWISDEFMKRVQNDEDWFLFDPLEVSDLGELYGKAFSERYAFYVAEAEAGRIRMFKRIKAREQFKSILISLQTTSHPWLTWKDTINNRALNNNTGTIHLSNLCTEITLPQDEDNVSVCNLASINLSQHFADGKVDFAKIEQSARLAVRQLDNLIDITRSSVKEADFSNQQNRAVGLGVMGFTDIVEKLGFSYESEESYDLIDEIMEHVSYAAIDESADLAKERGAYPNFEGSRWSEGLVPLDSIALMEADRGVPVKVNRTTRLDWDALRVKVKGGMRNATLMAIAPTASIGLVAGTTPGLDPQFSQIFSRSTSSGKFLEVNRNLVKDLQELGIWETVRENILRSQGDIQNIAAIPDSVKATYRTSFQLSPYAFLEVAARAQKWIDQAISRNMYLETRDLGDMMDIYFAGWERGVKTTYYLHMKPRHTAEQSTVKVDKSQDADGTKRKGFGGFGGGAPAVAPASTAPASTATAEAPAPQSAPAPRKGFGFGGVGGAR